MVRHRRGKHPGYGTPPPRHVATPEYYKYWRSASPVAGAIVRSGISKLPIPLYHSEIYPGFFEEILTMMRIRLFLSRKPAGFATFSESGCQMRPAGILSDESADAVRRALNKGHTRGSIRQYDWYRQASPSCPLNDTKPCPCDDEVCGLDEIVY